MSDQFKMLSEKVKKTLPHMICDFLDTFPNAFIMGGFVLSAMHDENFNDIDIFFYHKSMENVKYFFKEYLVFDDKIYWQFKNSNPHSRKNTTVHVFTVNVDGVKIDLVSYNDFFDPILHVDFYARMMQFNSCGIYAPANLCLSDAMNKILRLNNNWIYSNDPDGISTEDVNLVELHDRLTKNDFSDLVSWQQKFVSNVKKYMLKGYTLLE